MLIGYANSKWKKIATRQKEAKKVLSQKSAALVPQRLSQLAAFENLGEIPFRAPPLHLHLLTNERTGQKQHQGGFVIKLHGGDGIVFRPTDEFSKLDDGTTDTDTVTQVEIVFIGTYDGEQ